MFWAVFTCFSPYLGIECMGGGVLPRDWYTTCLCSFSAYTPQKIQVFETYFFDTMITYNDHPRYVKHFLGRNYVVFTLFGY